MSENLETDPGTVERQPEVVGQPDHDRAEQDLEIRQDPETDHAPKTVPSTQADQDSETATESSAVPRVLVDPRGQRFNAAVSVAVLAVALVAGVMSEFSSILLTLQGLAFGLGAMLGLRYQPYGWLFRTAIRPRLGAPANYEDEEPPRFAQMVGFLFMVIALIGVVLNFPVVAYVAVGFALVAAFLNAAFGICLGCLIYLTFKRATSK